MLDGARYRLRNVAAVPVDELKGEQFMSRRTSEEGEATEVRSWHEIRGPAAKWFGSLFPSAKF